MFATRRPYAMGRAPTNALVEQRLGCANGLRQSEREHGLGRVQAVLGLVPDGAARAVEDVGGDLLARVRREAVEDDRLGIGELEQLLVNGVARERGEARLALGLLAHARPDVGR